ncbi:MAG: alpha/beta fold hydrolase [Rhizobiales bacterium]|nr:alpha/beta fold hydrolase [Hyphomicrobiales bacterium]MBO6698858.1 alpha/beta fold hydrolase [Hyphomicrobiales bacterium]MBO6734889.1 alpha/beta fold hydrolase [Hyphomicrobiales bacterium]MBO6911305.1 alpha/beta fold hydrolase [Hyphomicrobiales bacterium]MBO6956197.1 alpha/beta fold hydrolase [Hyphomicrobiales bacterium]
MTQSPHAILVHGAWQGSWVWSDFAPFLENAGFRPHAIDLPGNGADDTPLSDVSLDLYLDHVGSLIEQLDGDIVIIAHSGGGVVGTALGERYTQRISAIAYIAGMMLPSGWSFGTVLANEKAEERGLLGIGPYLEWNDERTVSTVPPEAGAKIFLNDMDFDDALQGAQNLTPQAEPGRALKTDWTAERFGRIPRIYVECEQDLSVVQPIQQAMQKAVPGARNITLDAGHAPHVSQPQVLADASIPVLRKIIDVTV